MNCKESFFNDLIGLDFYLYASSNLPVPDNAPVPGGVVGIDTENGQTLGIKIIHAGIVDEGVSNDSSVNVLMSGSPVLHVTQQQGITPIIYTHEVQADVDFNIDAVRARIASYAGQYVYAVYVRANGERLMSLPVPNTAFLSADDTQGADSRLRMTFKCQSLSPALGLTID